MSVLPFRVFHFFWTDSEVVDSMWPNTPFQNADCQSKSYVKGQEVKC